MIGRFDVRGQMDNLPSSAAGGDNIDEGEEGDSVAETGPRIATTSAAAADCEAAGASSGFADVARRTQHCFQAYRDAVLGRFAGLSDEGHLELLRQQRQRQEEAAAAAAAGEEVEGSSSGEDETPSLLYPTAARGNDAGETVGEEGGKGQQEEAGADATDATELLAAASVRGPVQGKESIAIAL